MYLRAKLQVPQTLIDDDGSQTKTIITQICPGTPHWSDTALVRHPIGPTPHWSDTALVRHPIGPTPHWSDTPFVRHPIGPTPHWSDIQCYNMDHNGHGINQYGVLKISVQV